MVLPCRDDHNLAILAYFLFGKIKCPVPTNNLRIRCSYLNIDPPSTKTGDYVKRVQRIYRISIFGPKNFQIGDSFFILESALLYPQTS